MAKPTDRPTRDGVARFALTLETDHGLTYADCRRLERYLEDYADVQSLCLLGHQLRRLVCATERPVSVNDQMALIDWVIDLPGLVAVRVGQIVQLVAARTAEAGADEDAFVQVRAGDVALIGLTLLYRCGRIAPAPHLHILGGYVRLAATH